MLPGSDSGVGFGNLNITWRLEGKEVLKQGSVSFLVNSNKVNSFRDDLELELQS